MSRRIESGETQTEILVVQYEGVALLQKDAAIEIGAFRVSVDV